MRFRAVRALHSSVWILYRDVLEKARMGRLTGDSLNLFFLFIFLNL